MEMIEQKQSCEFVRSVFEISRFTDRPEILWPLSDRMPQSSTEILTSYDFVSEHLAGNRNPADGPSGRPDYEIGYERPTARLLAP